MFHYGWARPPDALRRKLAASRGIFTEVPDRIAARETKGRLDWTPLLRRFTGEHPRAARALVAARRDPAGPGVGPPHFPPEHLRLYPSAWIHAPPGVPRLRYP